MMGAMRVFRSCCITIARIFTFPRLGCTFTGIFTFPRAEARVALQNYIRSCTVCQHNKTEQLHPTGLL